MRFHLVYTNLVKDVILGWKVLGVFTLISLVVSRVLGNYSVIRTIGDYSILGVALSFLGFFLLAFTLVVLFRDWRHGKVHLLRFVTWKFFVVSLPVLMVLYQSLLLFLFENFVAFEALSTPFILIDLPIFFLTLYAPLPFQPLLESMGLWESSGGFMLWSGPTTTGLLLVALIYSLAIYVAWSILAWLLRHLTGLGYAVKS